nr:DUF4258 domain-containing protein [Nanoarchaeota archaeon]
MITLRLIITKHARQQMFDRGIDEEQIKNTIKKGSKIKQTDGFKSVCSYIGVCYKIKGEKYIIKTVTIE